MTICSNCGATIQDGGAFCPVCGAPVTANPYSNPNYEPIDPKNHTNEFSEVEVSENKLIAALTYFGIIGIIAAALINKDSAYVMFHIRQNLKLFFLETLSTILCIFIITVPIVIVFEFILFIVQIIGFIRTMRGKSIELPVVSAFGFLN